MWSKKGRPVLDLADAGPVELEDDRDLGLFGRTPPLGTARICCRVHRHR